MENNYEQKYKKALDNARLMYDAGNNDVKHIVGQLFPELAESEDERIIKAIKSAVLQLTDIYLQEKYGLKQSDCIAWLEKQGEKKASYTTIVETGNGGINALVTRELPTDGCDDEQKPADTVEPKFHEGEWVIDKQGIVHQISNVIENVTNHTYSYDIVGGGYFNDNTEGVRLWTIQDAKDGDVLVNGSNIFIFSHLSDTRAMGYCHINIDDGRFYDDKGKNECFGLIDAVFSPATKEQRDTLMKAMADAGYAFDFDKKKLKNIAQKTEENKGNIGGISAIAWMSL